MIKRHLGEICFNHDFGHQVHFIAGPRQVGKTTLARSYLDRLNMPKTYYNWDLRKIRDEYRKDPYFFETDVHDFLVKVLCGSVLMKFTKCLIYNGLHKVKIFSDFRGKVFYIDSYDSVEYYRFIQRISLSLNKGWKTSYNNTL